MRAACVARFLLLFHVALLKFICVNDVNFQLFDFLLILSNAFLSIKLQATCANKTQMERNNCKSILTGQTVVFEINFSLALPSQSLQAL